MSRSKDKKLAEKRAKEERLQEDIKAGKIRRVVCEERQKKPSLPNSKQYYGSASLEIEQRQITVENATYVYRQMLPEILKKLSRIKDYRKPGSVKHKMTTLMAYGILLFVYQIGSRRQANRECQ